MLSHQLQAHSLQEHRRWFEAGATLSAVLALALVWGAADVLARGHGLGSPLKARVAGTPHHKPEAQGARADRLKAGARAFEADELSRLRPAAPLCYTTLPVEWLDGLDQSVCPLVLPAGWRAYLVTWGDRGDEGIVVLRREPTATGARGDAR